MEKWLGKSQKRPNSPSKLLESSSKKWLPEYEAKRAKISPEVTVKWLSKYKWLSTVETSSQEGHSSTESSKSPMFFCKWCKKTGKNNSFASGKLFHFPILNKVKLFYPVY